MTENQGTEISDGQRMDAEGVRITLADGRAARLRFDVPAMRALERRFGSLETMGEHLSSNDAAKYTAVTDIIAIGLARSLPDLEGDDLLRLLDERRVLGEYTDAFTAAFAEAMPRPKKAAPDDGATTTDPPSFPGETSTTPRAASESAEPSSAA